MSTYSRGYDAARIGAFGLLAVIAFAGLFLYVTNRGLTMTRQEFYVQMPAATGLSRGDPVLFRGVKVGEVKDIEFMKGGDVLILAKLAEKVPLSVDAHAELHPIDMFGRQSVVLKDGARFAGGLQSGDTIRGMQPPSITAKITDLGVRAERMMSDSMVTLLRQTLAGSAAATEQIALLGTAMTRLVSAQQQNVTAMMDDGAVISRNLVAATAPQEIEAARSNMLRATFRMDSAAVMMSSLLAGLQRGEGSAGRLLRDDALFMRTEALLISLNELVVDVKANPKRYINLKVF